MEDNRERITLLLAAMRERGEFHEVNNPKDVTSAYVTYAVTQGPNILTIGSGKKERFKVLMGNKGPHNKAPLVGLCNRIYKDPIRFFICRYTEPESGGDYSVEERRLQDRFGRTWVDGHTEYGAAMRYLRGKLGLASNQIESILLDLMETHGDILNHALNTTTTAPIVEKLFDGYWKRSRRI